MGTNDGLERRVAELEEFVDDLQAFIASWAGKRKPPKQATLIPVEVKAANSDAIIHLRNALVERFERVTGKKYVFDGAKDAAAVKRLVFVNLLRDDVLSRWEEAFTAKFRGAQSIALFASRINEYGKKTAAAEPLRAPVKDDPYGS